jgi:asparagine synthase (glutamine-hydrolysing)
MVAVFGLFGGGRPADLAVVGGRLAHHGEQEMVWSPRDGATLGQRFSAADTTPPRVPLVFAGSIHNQTELAKLAPGDASGRSDAELLWDLYLTHGVEAFAKVNGQFAVALLDPDADSLVLAVDRWAARPLYFACLGDRGIFASEYKALLALDDVPARVNPSAFDVLQASKYLPIGDGLLADVKPVAPGGWVRLRPGAWEAGTYAPLQLDLAAEQPEDELAGELKDLLLAATRRLIEGASPIGLALSAGLDSTVTLGAIRAVAPDVPIYTYTASFQADDPDLKLAAEAARYYGTIHREIVISPDDLPRLLPEMVWTMEDPVAREEMVVYLVLVREAAKQVPFVLYGQLSDVLFAGMPRHLLVKAAGDLPWLSRPIADFYDYTQTGKAPATLLGRLLVGGYYRGRQTPPPKVLGAPPAAGGKGLALADLEPLNVSLLESVRYPTEVAVMERLHAQFGLRYGSIFHDLDVARCAFRVPDRLKIRGRTRKYILRQAAAKILPGHLAARPKGLIRMKRDQRLLEAVDAMADELLGPEVVAWRGMFAIGDVARLRRRPANGTYADDQFYHLWTMLLSEIWARTFIDGRGAGPISLPTSSRRVVATRSAFSGPSTASTSKPRHTASGNRERAA